MLTWDFLPCLLLLINFLQQSPCVNKIICIMISVNDINGNTSLAAPGALANRLQRRTARKANEANLDPPNQKSEITSL